MTDAHGLFDNKGPVLHAMLLQKTYLVASENSIPSLAFFAVDLIFPEMPMNFFTSEFEDPCRTN